MDLSALIFVALAVAWAVYLIPKALKHHDEVVRSRSVDKFSHRMRVLARREAVDRRNARLVVSPIRAALRPPVETKAHVTQEPVVPSASNSAAPNSAAPNSAAWTPAAARPAAPSLAAQRAAGRRAAKRRRNVLALILLANLVVIVLAATKVITWPWVAIPSGLLLAWLVACRLSVRAERGRRTVAAADAAPAPAPVASVIDLELTGEIEAVPSEDLGASESPVEAAGGESAVAGAPAVVTGEIPIVGGWDMVPTTLPTYVSKPAAQRRTVSTIDLDSTGVWSSGRNEVDSALARSAEESAKAAREAAEQETRRASGA